MTSQPTGKKRFRVSPRTIMRWGAIVLLVIGLLWLATWLIQRSLISSSKKRAMQGWLDERLNADVSLTGHMVVRLNLVRRSRLVLQGVEIEHPNPLFFSKFMLIGSIGAWSPPWAVLGLVSGHLEVIVNQLRMVIEENENGEWSTDGLMNPVMEGRSDFPFPMPKISNWNCDIRNSTVALRRHGNEFKVNLTGDLSGRPGRRRIALRTERLPFEYGPTDSGDRLRGTIGPATVAVRLEDEDGFRPKLIPGSCQVSVADLPARVLAFALQGIPLEEAGGVVNGTFRYEESPDAEGLLSLNGEVRDVPLAVFGLPRQAPVSVSWPIRPSRADLVGTIRMGPSGFGAFSIDVPLDAQGQPKQLVMRGDVAALDDIPALFTQYSRWPDWLSRTFPTIEWRSGRWLGFGWSGEDMHLTLTRSVAGLNLTGEAGLMKGRVRIAMTPDQPESPVTIAAEKVDSQLLAVKLSQLLPEAFRAQLTGTGANLTWRGFRGEDGAIGEWGCGLVFAKPVIDLAASGTWWHGLTGMTRTIQDALPEWGGGEAAALDRFAQPVPIPLDQLSIVVERGPEGTMMFEFRAYGESTGQATGFIERFPDGAVEGEVFLAGDSEFLGAIRQVNADLGLALDLLAHETVGLRFSFKYNPGGGIEFSYPFLEDARRIAEALREARNAHSDQPSELPAGPQFGGQEDAQPDTRPRNLPIP